MLEKGSRAHDEEVSSVQGSCAHEAVADLRALGTTVTLATVQPESIETARSVLVEELEAIDLACSRFRADS